jgi:hypothetical protein
MNKKEYQKLRDDLRQEYEKKLAALDMVWEMMGGKPTASSPSMQSGKEWAHAISKRDAVRETIKTINGEFNMHAVRHALLALHPAISQEIEDNALSAIISKLAEMEEITTVRHKVGKAPAIYKRKEAALSAVR